MECDRDASAKQVFKLANDILAPILFLKDVAVIKDIKGMENS